MSKMAHTPGPWRTTPNGVVTSDSCQIAHVGETSRPADMVGSFERWDADARLIAAAPDLLVALEQLVSDYERGIHVEFGGSPWLKEKLEELDYARAAIAKATGAADE